MGNDHQNDLHISARAIDIHNREVYRRELVTVAVDARSFSYRWSAELSVRLESFRRKSILSRDTATQLK